MKKKMISALKRPLKKIGMRTPPIRRALIKFAKHMALSGEGTDECLQQGFLPVAVHYYQPIPDIEELKKRKVWDRRSRLGGIEFEPQKYLSFLENRAPKYAGECVWPDEPDGHPEHFYLHNGCFSYGCAAPLHCIIRHDRPNRIIEIGSGNSSKVIAAAVEKNHREGHATQYTIIDPYSNLDKSIFPNITEIIRKPVELLDPEFFRILEDGDILFIDSSHACKIGSDVNFEILEVLPLLKKGVLVHFHDIPLPYEYPIQYTINPSFRVFWTEAYLLQAFLAFNSSFEIVLPMFYLEKHFMDQLVSMFPNSKLTVFGFESQSFWIRRVEDRIKTAHAPEP